MKPNWLLRSPFILAAVTAVSAGASGSDKGEIRLAGDGTVALGGLSADGGGSELGTCRSNSGNNNGNNNRGDGNGNGNSGNNNGNNNRGDGNGNANSGDNNGNNNVGSNNGNRNETDNNGNNGVGDNQGNGTRSAASGPAENHGDGPDATGRESANAIRSDVLRLLDDLLATD